MKPWSSTALRVLALLLALALACPRLVVAQVPDDDQARDDAGAIDQVDQLPPLRFAGDEVVGGEAIRRELVGLVVAGVEHPAGIEILRMAGDRLFLPLRRVADALAVSVVDEPTGLRVDTPLGPARFDPGEVRPDGGDYVIAASLLARRLALGLRFDDSAYALRIDPAWPIVDRAGQAPDSPIQPDATAPGLDLARLRGELRWRHDAFEDRFSGRVEAGGRAGPGSWQIRADDNGEGRLRAYDYHWRLRRGGFAAWVGHQTLGLHPLLSSFDLTGVQGAWTNAPDRLLANAEPDQLVADRPGAVRTLRGEGPPGGRAELIVDGRLVDQQRIRLDGIFEFVAVPIPLGQVQVEVLLYDSAIAATPEARLDFSQRASDRVLGAGEHVLHAGFGQDGNPLDELRPDRGSVAFARGRRALGERVTVEAAVQSGGLADQALVGLDALAGPIGVVGAAMARGKDGSAWLGSVEGGHGAAFWRAYALRQDAGFRGPAAPALDERSGEVGLRRWPRWEVSVVGRERRETGSVDVSFVKPAARLRPWSNLYLQARPDFFGDYVYDVEWRPLPALRLAGHRDSRVDEVRSEWRMADAWLVAASSSRDRPLDRRRDSLVGTWQQPSFGGWLVEAGVLHSEGRSGFVARVGRELMPGLQLRAEAIRDPLYAGVAGLGGTIANVSLAFDFGRANGRFTRGGAVRVDAGAVGGAIVASGGDSGSLAGVTVRVDGQPRGVSDAAGRFHIGGLAPGVYRIELDEEGLPLEWAGRGDAYWAEVAAGAVTSVDFRVELRLGAAGRVIGAVAPDAQVEVVAERGVVATAPVDAHGWFRVDGLPPGRYALRLRAAGGETVAERELLLVDRFVFAQDFDTGSPRDPAPE